MATVQHYRAKIDFRQRGKIPAPRFRIAVRAALIEAARPLLTETKRLAAARTKRSPSLTNRGRRRYREQMRDRYDVRVLADAKTLSLYNPLLRGRIFEVGSRPHAILPKHSPLLYYRNRRGEMVRSRGVMHPGTKAQYPMRDALIRVQPQLENSLVENINDQLRVRG